MPTTRLTKTIIDGFAATAKETVFWDTTLPGFGVKVTPAGRKVFIVLYRTAESGRLRKYTVGPYGQFTLAQARAAAQQVLGAKSAGRDPAAEKLASRQRATNNVVDDLVAEFLLKHASRNRSAAETERVFRREVLPRWHGRSVHEISKRDVLALVEEIHGRGAPIMANRVLAAVRKFFNWLIGRGVMEVSPCGGVPAPARERSRDRVLDDQELSAVLRAADLFDYPFGSIVALLALTGQRRDEVANMRWDEIDEATAIWALSATRTKNGKPHFVHLSDPAKTVLAAVPRLGAFAFSLDGNRPFQNFGRAMGESG